MTRYGRQPSFSCGKALFQLERQGQSCLREKNIGATVRFLFRRRKCARSTEVREMLTRGRRR